ncbi:exo-alpha-sialidase [Aquimarina litoralis]|uniref:Exo-alpha-sialidase n=1 Tax=Aquimarina litoralis TaxID=584605 RepID=A0ABN1IUK1_9FLAO
MTQKNSWILFLVLMVVVTPFILINVNSTPEKQNSTASLLEEYPNEWMYNQRAYPNNFINKKAVQRAIEQHKIAKAKKSIQETNWELIGPSNISGRITDVAISPVNDNHLYLATATGGVLRSYDRGDNWEFIFDDIAVPSIGSIAIAPSDPQRIYVGTGEANGTVNSGAFFGNGIYRSDDGGDSWINIGLEETNHTGRIVVDPTNPDRVFVAATGILYGTNNERGIYRTTDGGNTWEQVLFLTDTTAGIDVAINPVDTDIIFAAMWERTRRPYGRDYAGTTSGLHRSTDGGETWEKLTNGLPISDEETGRIGIAISSSDPNIIYARYTTNSNTNVFNGIYKSIDNGNSWVRIPDTGITNVDASFGWFFGNLRVHPDNPDEIFVLGQSLYKTEDSGSSWEFVDGMHVDHHAMEFSKTDANFILAGNDGGAYISEDRGTTWTLFPNVPITQFYNIEVDFLNPTNLFGGTQDNNTIRNVNGNVDWFSIKGGDGFHVNVDPVDNDFVYAESQFGNLSRSVDGGFTFSRALTGINQNDRTNWNTPVILSPFNPEIVFYGSNRLYKSENRALSWSSISDDLTDGEHPSGSLSFGTLTAIAASYLNVNTIYTGSDDGNVNVTFNGGTTWQNISSGLPDRYVTSLAIHPQDDQTIYVTLSGYGELDYSPHVFKSNNGGQTWEDISANLPSIPVNDIIIIPNTLTSENVLTIATDMGVWYSDNDGVNWNILGNNLPATIMRDLKYHEPTKELYVGTFGRSMHKIKFDDFVLSVEENTISENVVDVFPNPVSDQLNLNHSLQGEGSISIYSIEGQLVKELFNGDLTTTQSKNYNVSDLSTGIYLLHLKNNEQKATVKKLIIN